MCVARLGGPADDPFLLTVGHVMASLRLADGCRRLLSTIGAGCVLGELAFLGTEVRTADVLPDSPLAAFVLGRRAFDELGQFDPALKAALLENLLRIVVRVARRMTDEVAALAGLRSGAPRRRGLAPAAPVRPSARRRSAELVPER